MSYANEALVYSQLRKRETQLDRHIEAHPPDSATFKQIYGHISSLVRAYRQMEDPIYSYITEGMIGSWSSVLRVGYPNHPPIRTPNHFDSIVK